jgi:hypothetical protein
MFINANHLECPVVFLKSFSKRLRLEKKNPMGGNYPHHPTPYARHWTVHITRPADDRNTRMCFAHDHQVVLLDAVQFTGEMYTNTMFIRSVTMFCCLVTRDQRGRYCQVLRDRSWWQRAFVISLVTSIPLIFPPPAVVFFKTSTGSCIERIINAYFFFFFGPFVLVIYRGKKNAVCLLQLFIYSK